MHALRTTYVVWFWVIASKAVSLVILVVLHTAMEPNLFMNSHLGKYTALRINLSKFKLLREVYLAEV
jgi:hypothetical protein